MCSLLNLVTALESPLTKSSSLITKQRFPSPTTTTTMSANESKLFFLLTSTKLNQHHGPLHSNNETKLTPPWKYQQAANGTAGGGGGGCNITTVGRKTQQGPCKCFNKFTLLLRLWLFDHSHLWVLTFENQLRISDLILKRFFLHNNQNYTSHVL